MWLESVYYGFLDDLASILDQIKGYMGLKYTEMEIISSQKCKVSKSKILIFPIVLTSNLCNMAPNCIWNLIFEIWGPQGVGLKWQKAENRISKFNIWPRLEI